MSNAPLTYDDYTVAWICPLEVERIAATIMLDDTHPRLPQPPTDHNAYTLGSIKGHNVVIAGLPVTGNTSTATVVAQMTSTYQQLRFGLLVGIGGGVPTRTEQGHIRLGHVVVSKPVGQHSGAVQYDHGKAEAGKFYRTGFLAPPPNVLLNAAQSMSVARALASSDPLDDHLQRIDTSKARLRHFKYPGVDLDHLYEPDYVHTDRGASCKKCGCDPSRRVERKADESDDEEDEENADKSVVVHRGTIAAGEMVMRDGLARDRLAKEYSVLCFEMEAAGALNNFPCLVIRGISDYSDSHKNDKWHGYAAAAAAAYARELFVHMPVDEVKQCKIAESDVKQIVEDTRSLAHSAHEDKIKRWLDPPDASTNHNEARKQHYRSTGSWFLESEQYKQWRARRHGALWLHGIPGCGKTVLSSIVIEDLQTEDLQAGQGCIEDVVLYFYFDFNDAQKQSLEKMILSLVFQLYQQREGCQQYVERLHFLCKNGHKQPSGQALRATLYGMLEASGDTTIVLDALDECETRKELLSWLAASSVQKLHVFLTSRKEEDIESSLSKWILAACVVPIQHKAVDKDIRAVVRSVLAEDDELQRWKYMPKVHDEIESELMEKADGMFRWAQCQLDALK